MGAIARRRGRKAGGAALAMALALLSGCGRSGGADPPAGAAPAEAASAPIAGPMAPALDVADLGGAMVGLSEYRGRPVIINFWATWCGPCRREMPSLVRLHEKLTGAGLRILVVSIDVQKAAVERYLQETPLPMRVLLDPMHVAADRFGVVTIPSSFILDPEGRVVERLDGEADWTNPELLATLDRLLRMPAAPTAGASRDHAT